jgi:hypothetical protein
VEPPLLEPRSASQEADEPIEQDNLVETRGADTESVPLEEETRAAVKGHAAPERMPFTSPFAGVKMERLPSGALRIEAPPESAALLASLLRGVAELFAHAPGLTPTQAGIFAPS